MNTVKVKLHQIVNSEKAFASLLTQKLPVKAAYRLQKLAKKIGDELETYRKVHLELIQKHGGIEEGGNWRVPAEALPAFVPEFEELVNQEVELEFLPLSPDDLGNAEISAIDLMLLEHLFVDADVRQP